MRLYRESNVVEYWIVDPELETFEFLENQPDGFRVRLAEAGIYRSALIAGLEIDVEAFWRIVPSEGPAPSGAGRKQLAER